MEIWGMVGLRTTFDARPNAKAITVKFTIVNASASYNMILGRPTLNKFRETILIPHLYMKYPVADRIGIDVFAWSPEDMPGIDRDFLYHRLSITLGTRLVFQKKRNLREEKRRVAKKKTSKLLATRSIKEVWYPTWLANMVMVRKSNGKWRICTDYTNLNKVCLKYPYPLPSIDQLVDEASKYDLLSFMDTYFRNNQIRMHPKTRQRRHSSQIIFKDHVGCKLEVYVDDMVVKTTTDEQHCEALTQVFTILKKHKLKLNPEKCSFGVQAGKFLGFILTRRGIEANLEKCKALINMRSPRSVKEVQQLAGRIMALAHILPQSIEKALPIFQCLRKNERFQWTNKCEEAFQ
ncbi:hypothetical protein CR513_44901, partial [Mucuna pruriens]